MTDYALSSDDLVIGTYGGVAVAPVGTTLPTAWDSVLDAAFTQLGYLTPAGPSLPSSPTVQDIRAWQASDPVASRVKERGTTVNFELMQWNAETVPFAYGGGAITAAGTGYKFTPPTGEAVEEYSLVCDVLDGDNVVRYVFERGYPAAGTSPTFNRDDAAVLSVGYKVLTPADGSESFFILSNLAGWGGS